MATYSARRGVRSTGMGSLRNYGLLSVNYYQGTMFEYFSINNSPNLSIYVTARQLMMFIVLWARYRK